MAVRKCSVPECKNEALPGFFIYCDKHKHVESTEKWREFKCKVPGCSKMREPGHGGFCGDHIMFQMLQGKPQARLTPESNGAMMQGTPHNGSIRMPADPQERKDIPLVRGLLDYFPEALCEVARVSKQGNDQHNPGEEIHWARGKSMDHADCIVRHLIDRGTRDSDGHRHSAKAAWRALALLQMEIEQDEGLPPSRGSK